MTRYNYQCVEGCTVGDYIKKDVPVLEIFVSADVENYKAEPFVWEVIYPITEEPTIKCPICDEKSKRTMAGCKITGYVKGNGYLDKAGIQRHMNLHKLKTEDPYASIRPDGDAEELEKKINKVGRKSMVYKIRGDQDYIKGIDKTNIEAVQEEKQKYLEGKNVSQRPN